MRRYFSVRRYVLNVLQNRLSRFAEKISAKKIQKIGLGCCINIDIVRGTTDSEIPITHNHLSNLQFCRPCGATVVLRGSGYCLASVVYSLVICPFQFWGQPLSRFKTGCSLDKLQLQLHALHMIMLHICILHICTLPSNFLNVKTFSYIYDTYLRMCIRFDI